MLLSVKMLELLSYEDPSDIEILLGPEGQAKDS